MNDNDDRFCTSLRRALLKSRNPFLSSCEFKIAIKGSEMKDILVV